MFTLYEAIRAIMMSLRGDNDHDVGHSMASVHGQLLHLLGGVDALRA